MAPAQGGTDKSAKEVLDEIGGTIQKGVHRSAVDYINDLQGDLSKVRFKDEKIDTQNICNLDHTKHTNVSWGVVHPCDNRLANLFSEESASQCSTSRISGNDNNSGSCAPYRKLQLCDYNLERITDTNTTNTNNLLVDVLLAAKHEGDSLSKYIKEHPEIIPKSNICTVLARSFADIGDIIRGKDLYVGNRKEREKEKLQTNLKNIFEKLKSSNPQLTNVSLEKIREYWWALNRREVWKAIICSAPEDAKYFRKTACGGGTSPTQDYVPQFLRWFEEWAEEFCRIKQLKLKKLEKECRGMGEDDKKRYCSRNGYDCTGTIRRRNIFRPDPECTNCLFECNHYQDWIDNKMEEFKKQKQKCENEIYKTSRTNKKSNNNVNVMYYDDFYKELQGKYKSTDMFLNSLNEETKCKSIEQIDKESKIDFKDSEKTFSASKYCKPCPECGVKKENGEFKVRGHNEKECEVTSDNSIPNVVPTAIDVLYSGVERKHISEKLKEFCTKDNVSIIKENEKWECYYKSSVDNKCIMQTNSQKVEGHSKIMKFDEFFTFWVTYMLNDCIDWKKKITKCINNGIKWRCKYGCKGNCKCFEKWVKKKQDEWNHIKKQYEKQTDLVNKHHFGIREIYLVEQFFPLIKKAYGNEDAIEKIQEFLDKKSKQEDDEIEDKRDIIDILLEHELDEATECISNNPDDEKCPEQSKEEQDSEDEDDDETPRAPNPCVDKNDSQPTKTVSYIARQLHRRAKAQMTKNSVVDGDNKLVGNISKAKFRDGGDGKGLDKDICNIDTKYSNDSRGSKGEPCTGKDGSKEGVRMKIGNGWTHVEENQKLYKDFYLPPRRQHMCTSNLENLDVGSVTKGGKAIHSLLGDVLLTAKMDADEIIKRYKHQNNIQLTDSKHLETMCRAVRYSFADLGDIIRGRDMWDEDSGAKHMENNFKKIFEKIKKHPEIQGKYNTDGPPYKQLREDWWLANRSQIWKAMQCAYSGGKCSGMPVDDYIPQRLRWMTEWAEWYCKEQSMLYNKLVADCGDCMKKGEGGKECMNGSGECRKCKQACEEYKKKIKKWEDQWNNMQVQNTILYHLAKTTSRDGIDAYAYAVGDKDKPVVAFLQKLQEANKSSASKRSKRHITIVDPSSTPKTPYSTAAGYIHQELQQVGCNTQKEFCKNGNGEKYTFENPPPLYKDACNCENNTRPPVPPKKKEDACDIMDKLYRTSNNGKHAINSCYPKNYNGWTCETDKFENGHDGACMPPRRQSLCIHNLENNIIGTEIKEDDLREAFIKCASAETFLLWKKYKEDKKKEQKTGTTTKPDEVVQIQLESGTIPDDFKRRMFYTFGDYRDLCIGTDISSKKVTTVGVGKVKINIDAVFQKMKRTTAEQRENWWDGIKEDVWKGMLCALEKAGDDKVKFTDNPAYNYETVTFSGDNSHTLEEFTTRPQFLRWMTEWGEHFCREHKVEKGKLAAKCGDCAVDPDDGSKCDGECGECQEQCQAYKRWIKTWQDNYKKQKQRYTEVKDNPQYNNDNDVLGTTHAYEYLNKKLEKICQSEITSVNCEYKCMEQASSQNGKHMPESLDDTPNEYKDRCTCKDKEAPTPRPSDPPAKEEEQQEGACTIVDNIFKDEDDDYFKEACRQKYKGGKEIDTQWKCTTNKTKKGGQDEVCIPPRRQKLYVYNLTQLKDTSSQTELRRAFVQCAAIETFLAWHKYKMDKKQTQQQNGVGGLPLSVFGFGIGFDEEDTTIEEDPQEQLNGGDIPDQFKRQMFYTFGDYRDILFGKDVGNGNDIEEVKNKIKTVFQNSTDPDEQNDNEREKWWEQHGKDIWKGMVCVLSYDTDSKQIKQDVQDKLVGSKSGNKYDYTNVSFSGGFNSDKNAATITTKLEEFSRRPTFFRWLEEWGEEFCKKRTYKLKRIKDECRSDKYGKRYSSGDGEDCQNMLREDYNIVPDLEYPGCGKSCKSYKDWINTKKKEFKKHEEKYKMEISNNKSNSDNTYHIEFYKNIKTTNHTATQFLASLKEGSCCNNNNGENKINFNEQGEIFGHAKLCAPCPVFGVKRNKDDWINITDKTCKGKKFTEENIKNNKNRNEKVHMLVIDNSTKDFAEELEVCRDKGIFDGIRKDEWSCGYVCDVDICDLESVKEGMDDQKNIQIRAVLKQWLENFLKDYNKINDKISQCNKNGKESICINKCKNKCVCAEKWVDEKLKEWEKVKKRFFDQYHINDSQVYEVKSFLSKNIFSSGVQNILDEVKDSETLQKSAGCTNSASTKEQKCEKKDVITILIDRFKEKITSCKNQPDDGTHSNCDDSLEPLDPETPDEQPEEDPDTSTTSVVPHICEQFVAPEPQPPAPPAQDRTSEDASTEEKEEVPASPAPSEEVKPPEEVVPEKKGPPAPPKKPSTPRRRPREITRSILPEMVSISAFPLSVGIAFAALSYFLLKKKTKSTIDLLRVINIPKGDYGIPTMKSKNRYIPYASDRYKGKTYIYMEGDSDSGHYYEDTTDITSSESEYEEFDINDIYVPGSSKYKTLIEVVLEPSKRDTMNTQNDIPLNDKLDSNKLTDEEWNQLKQDFISNISQNSQMDLPKNNISGNIQMDTHPHVNILDDSMQEKPFITSIHDRNLHNGEEVSYNLNLDDHKNMNFSTNHDNIPPKNDQNDLYTGIDLINDSISGNHNVNIYDELLKRKENELFGTNHTKHTTTNIVAKQTHNDPIVNQINLFHKWLDRHRNMCEQWDKNKKEELLDKLNEEWNKENKNNNDMEKYCEPYYNDIYEDDIYYDVDDDKDSVDDKSPVDSNNAYLSNEEQIEMNFVNNKTNELF
ncbi:erythrocyte membrane protein 1 [Plasmodium falciparum IGH-CR14]|uniref:Erythrocyte membrane protein 1 n=1 Tax=Plasmodium falciparum IGH-CR14 TaxID=580059 RepID=A0A0L1IDF9_PLAFA|nr:erythrocyte membrane protein 1 [Plasmodium falciparum IGH-CR14]